MEISVDNFIDSGKSPKIRIFEVDKSSINIESTAYPYSYPQVIHNLWITFLTNTILWDIHMIFYEKNTRCCVEKYRFPFCFCGRLSKKGKNGEKKKKKKRKKKA